MTHVIQPLGARVLVQIQAVEEQKLASGIMLAAPTDARETYKSEVVNIGGDVALVKVGDLVLITLGGGDGVEHDQEAFRIVDEDDILAIIER